MTFNRPTLRKSGSVRVTLYVRQDIEWHEAVRIVAAELCNKDDESLTKAQTETIIRQYLKENGDDHIAYLHEQRDEWDEYYANAEELMRHHYPLWWEKERSRGR